MENVICTSKPRIFHFKQDFKKKSVLVLLFSLVCPVEIGRYHAIKVSTFRQRREEGGRGWNTKPVFQGCHNLFLLLLYNFDFFCLF